MSEEFDTSWFDLSKYDRLSDFELPEWQHQLAIRHWLYNLIFNPKRFKSVDHKRVKLNDVIASFLNEIKQHPLLQHEYEFELHGDTRFFIKNPLPSDTYLVSSIRLYEMCLEAEILPNELESMGLSPEFIIGQEYTEHEQNVLNTPYSYFIDGIAGYNKAIAWIKISLQGTDDEIMKSFQTWLTEHRKERNYFSKEKSFTNKTLAK